MPAPPRRVGRLAWTVAIVVRADLELRPTPPAAGQPAPSREVATTTTALLDAAGRQLVGDPTVNFLLDKPAHILLLLVLTWVASRLIGRAIGRLVRRLEGSEAHQALQDIRQDRAPLVDVAVSQVRSAQRAETIGALLRSVAAFVVWTVALLTVITELDVKVAPLLAGASVLGAALGFGAQNLVRDFLAGFFVVMEDQYGVGDVIDAGPATGRVEGVSLRKTRLRDLNGTVWHIPNGQMTRVGNMSQEWSQAVLDIEVHESADIDRAAQVIEGTARQVCADDTVRARIVEDPEVWGVERIGDEAVAIRLAVRTLPMSRWRIARELRARIKSELDQHGIPLKTVC